MSGGRAQSPVTVRERRLGGLAIRLGLAGDETVERVMQRLAAERGAGERVELIDLLAQTGLDDDQLARLRAEWQQLDAAARQPTEQLPAEDFVDVDRDAVERHLSTVRYNELLVEGTEPAPPPPTTGRGISRYLGERYKLAATSLELEPSAGQPADEPLGRYPVLGKLGAGGMGEVLRVKDPDLGRDVAAKLLPPESPRRVIRSFVLEARITGQLDHPNIVPVHEIGVTDDDRLYYTMKAVKGETLEALIDRPHDGSRRALLPLLQIFLKICDALALAHSKRVIHRDVKPANVMVGAFGEVLVMDWGLAKVVGSSAELPDDGRAFDETNLLEEDSSIGHDPLRTLDGTVMGTPAYMAPEQAQGRIEALDARTDIYALGAILYHMLTGAPPFEGTADTLSLLRMVIAGRLTPPSLRAPRRQVPRELEAVVLKAMAVAPDERYDTVEALEADIQAYLGGHVVAAARYTRLQRVGKWAARHPALAASLAFVLIGLGALVATIQHRRAAELRGLTERADRLVGETPPTLLARVRGLVAARTDDALQQVESGPERAAREAALQAHLSARSALERAVALSGREAGIVGRRVEVGEALGWIALLGRDYSVARQAFDELAEHGVSASRVAALLARVESRRTALQDRRRARLEAILTDLGEGLSRPGRDPSAPRLGDYVLEAVGYRDPQTVEVLAGAIAEDLAKARGAGRGAVWSQSERDRLRFVCRVLGRLGLVEAVEPLARLAAVVADSRLMIEVGLALCNTRRPEAYAPLVALRRRAGTDTAWATVRLFVNRVPEPAAVRALARPSASALVTRAAMRGDAGRGAEALADLEQALALDPEQGLAYARRGDIHRTAGRLQEALADYDRALALRRVDGPTLNSRGLVQEALGNHVAALADYDRAMKHIKHPAGVLCNRGQLLLALGRREDAARDFARAIELDRTFFAGYFGRAELRRRSGDRAGAERDYSRAIELNPRQPIARHNRGLLRLKLGRLAEAEEDLTRAIELRPGDAASYNSRGLVRYKQGRLQAARADLDQAIALNPRLPDAWTHRGLVRRAQGDVPGALADHGRALELAPDHVPALINRAGLRQREGQLDQAMADIERALTLDATHATAHEVRAEIWLSRMDGAKAEAAASRAIELDPQLAVAWRTRGSARVLLARFAEARADLDRAVSLAPRDPWAYFHRGRVRLVTNDDAGAIGDFDRALELRPGLSDALFMRSQGHLALKHWPQVLADASAALKLDPTLLRAYLTRALAYLRLEQPKPALADLERCLEGLAGELAVHIYHGTALVELGRFREAVTAYGKAIALSPKDPELYGRRAQARAAADDVGGAIEDLGRVLALTPDDPVARSARGRLRLRSGDAHGAIRDAQEALQRAPDAVHDGHLVMGLALVRLGRHLEAEAAFGRALAKQPRRGEALFQRGLARYRLGRHQDALADLGRVLALDPGFYDALVNRSLVWLKLDRPADALADLDRAIALDPRRYQAFANRGLLHRQARRYDQAAADLRQAIRRAPRVWGLWYALGLSLRDSGDVAGARKALREALAKSPPGAARRQVEAALATLE